MHFSLKKKRQRNCIIFQCSHLQFGSLCLETRLCQNRWKHCGQNLMRKVLCRCTSRHRTNYAQNHNNPIWCQETICCNRNCNIKIWHCNYTSIKPQSLAAFWPESLHRCQKFLFFHTHWFAPIHFMTATGSEQRGTRIGVAARFSHHRPGWRWQELMTDYTVTTALLQKLSATPYFSAPTWEILSETPHENPITEALKGSSCLFCYGRQSGEKDIKLF